MPDGDRGFKHFGPYVEAFSREHSELVLFVMSLECKELGSALSGAVTDLADSMCERFWSRWWNSLANAERAFTREVAVEQGEPAFGCLRVGLARFAVAGVRGELTALSLSTALQRELREALYPDGAAGWGIKAEERRLGSH